MPDAASPFRLLDRRRAFEQIIFRIEEALLSGALRPGDKLPSERDLAESFGVSRPSVREALRALEVFGVVVARQGTGEGAGSIVTNSAAAGVTSALRLHIALLQIPTREVVEVRLMIESYSVRRAVASASVDDIAGLREVISRMTQAADVEAFHELDTDFHVKLAQSSGNALLTALMESIRGAMHRDMVEGFKGLPDWRLMRDELTKQHQMIVDSIESRDSEAAVAAVDEHIMHFYAEAIEPSQNDRTV
jgi:GntR family transcriptional regulator, transcriptional repressor for pyruvate dehydrogenase complex